MLMGALLVCCWWCVQGYEVIYMTDVLDEYVMQQLTEFEDYKFANIAKEDVDLTGEAEGEVRTRVQGTGPSAGYSVQGPSAGYSVQGLLQGKGYTACCVVYSTSHAEGSGYQGHCAIWGSGAELFGWQGAGRGCWGSGWPLAACRRSWYESVDIDGWCQIAWRVVWQGRPVNSNICRRRRHMLLSQPLCNTWR